MISLLLLASGLLIAGIPGCQDDSVFRSGDVPPSILDAAGLGDSSPADGAVGGMGGGGTGGAPTDSDGGAD